MASTERSSSTSLPSQNTPTRNRGSIDSGTTVGEIAMHDEVVTEHSTGSLRVRRLGPRSSHFILAGHLDAALTRAIIVEGTRLTASGHAIAFHDWSALRTYSTEARQLSTEWTLAQRHNFELMAIYVSSSIVAMGVNVANLALGGFIRATTDAAAFATMLREHHDP
jgi:hypothetical protein